MKTITLDAEFADEIGKSHHLKFKHFERAIELGRNDAWIWEIYKNIKF